MWWLSLIATAEAHGAGFGAIAVSKTADDALWVVTDGSGLARSADGGETWEWLCEEAIGGAPVYDVVGISATEAWAGTRDGLVYIDAACGASFVPGLPEGAFVPRILSDGPVGVVAAVTSADAGGFYRCDTTACHATEGVGAGIFPKSMVRDGETIWATVVYTDTLLAELWRSEDAETWTAVATWPDGDVDPRIVRAQGNTIFLWERPRADDGVPALMRSDDGGLTFTSVLAVGSANDLAPGFATPDGTTMLFGQNSGARTWRSTDAGVTWAEVSGEAPAVRCGYSEAGVAYTCGDHLADGIDLALTTDGVLFRPVACLEEAKPATCVAATCEPYLASFTQAGAYGGGRCDTIIGPVEDTADTTPPAGDCGCGALSAGAAGGSALVVFLGVAGMARGPRRARRTVGAVAAQTQSRSDCPNAPIAPSESR